MQNNQEQPTQLIKNTQDKINQLNSTNQQKKNWIDDDQIFNAWAKSSNHGCKIRIQNIPYMTLRQGYGVPCSKPNVMNTTIPAGSRAGARPCGASWKAFGGIYIEGVTERVYCSKCWRAYCLTNGKEIQSIYAQLGLKK